MCSQWRVIEDVVYEYGFGRKKAPQARADALKQFDLLTRRGGVEYFSKKLHGLGPEGQCRGI